MTFMVAANATLQLATPPEMRGRVLALWSMAFRAAHRSGTIVGWIGETRRSAMVDVRRRRRRSSRGRGWPILSPASPGRGIGSSPRPAVAAAAAATDRGVGEQQFPGECRQTPVLCPLVLVDHT